MPSKKILHLFCLLAFAAPITALGVGKTQASGLLTHLTPANLSRQQLAIAVRCTSTPRGEQFRVVVRHRAGIAYHFMQPTEGWLKAGPFINGTEGDALPYPVTVTNLGKEAVVYLFTLPTHYRADTRFEFGYTGYDKAPLMPAGDFYWFLVSAFVHRTAVKAR